MRHSSMTRPVGSGWPGRRPCFACHAWYRYREFQEVAGYNAKNFGKGEIARFGKLLEPGAIADGVHWLLSLPPDVNVNEIMIRPPGQSYP